MKKRDSYLGRPGELHHKAKLTKEKVLKIRQQLEIGVPVRTLAKRFEVSETTIRDIKTCKTWSHI